MTGSTLKRTMAILALVWLAGCAGPAGTPPTPTARLSGPSDLSIGVASNDFPTGAPRVPFVLFRGSQALADARSVQLTAFDLGTGTPVPGWIGAAEAFADYDVPYWVAYPDLPHPGYWGLVAVVTLAGGETMQAQFTVQALDDPQAPTIGEAVPPSNNRTLATQPDIAKLTSDPEPEPGLYRMTVAEAVTTGRPTVVTFATPAFCESRLCAPVVNSVKEVRAAHAEEANFIHIEVFESFEPRVYAREMDEWHLTSEPWTFVLDAEGKVAARLGGPVSPQELEAALAKVAGNS